MFRGKNSLPTYRHHRASGQAVVTLDVYLGPHGTKLSKDNYDRVVAEWLAAGRSLPRPSHQVDGITVAELVNAFRKSPEPSGNHSNEWKVVMSLAVRLYGRTAASDFGPISLKAVREEMIKAGWNRRTINGRIYMVRRFFRWGVEHEMVPPSVNHALQAVAGLRAGKSPAPEPGEVQPVAADHVDATIPHMPTMVQTMVRLQMHTGMRPGEMVIMRTVDIDTSGKVWVYTPKTHKTQHLGKVREIAIGPKAQALLQPYLLTDLQAFIFSPAASEAERRAGPTPIERRRSRVATCPDRT